MVAADVRESGGRRSAAEGEIVERLDQLLYRRGVFSSREKARRAVMAGLVAVDGRRADKPGRPVRPDVVVAVAEREPYVSRGGRKLAAALDHFGLDPRGLVCLDVGASTGGFTDCLLERGAERVYALDVGYGQLDHGLRQDPRVVVMERVNARHLEADALPESCDLVTLDVSFISVVKVLPAVLPHLHRNGLVLPMLKPQFEAGRAAVGKGGVVRDAEVRRAVVTERVSDIEALGLECRGVFDSPLPGAKGNVETFALFSRKISA